MVECARTGSVSIKRERESLCGLAMESQLGKATAPDYVESIRLVSHPAQDLRL